MAAAETAVTAAAVLTLVGAINLPIIKFSVDWWNTLHQPASITRLDAPATPERVLMAVERLRGGK